MKRIVLDYFEDIIENCRVACEFVGAMGYNEFSGDRKTLYAVLRALEVISEAAKRVPDEVRARHPAIDWRGMSGLRDVIIHQYDRIDYRVRFEVVTAQLP